MRRIDVADALTVADVDDALFVERSLVKHLASFALTVCLLVVLNFFLPRAMPGDPVDALLSQASPTYVYGEESRAALVEYYDLDRPLLAQFGGYLAGLARGDLGRSITFNQPVADLVRQRLPWTLLLGGTAAVVATAVGLLAGAGAGWRQGARRRRTWRRRSRGGSRSRGNVSLVLFLGLRELPSYFLGSMALFALAVKVDWFPLAGARSPFTDDDALARALDVGHHLVLPAATLAAGIATSQFLLMRAGMVSELGADYLRLGQAKGLPERRLKYRYAARNALLPVVTNTALLLSLTVTASVLIEEVFAYPGLGQLTFDAISRRDYPLLQGCFLVTSGVAVTVNLAADLLNRRLDPRTGTA